MTADYFYILDALTHGDITVLEEKRSGLMIFRSTRF